MNISNRLVELERRLARGVEGGYAEQAGLLGGQTFPLSSHSVGPKLAMIKYGQHLWTVNVYE